MENIENINEIDIYDFIEKMEFVFDKDKDFRTIRAELGMTRIDFGKKFDIPNRTLYNWEAPEKDTNKRRCPEYIDYMVQFILFLEDKIAMYEIANKIIKKQISVLEKNKEPVNEDIKKK